MFPTSSLGRQLEEVAKLIRIRQQLGQCRQFFYVSRCGCDNHSTQLSTHINNLNDVDAAITAFQVALVETNAVDNVIVFFESDFSRTFESNSNASTDHAWGQPLLAWGGVV